MPSSLALLRAFFTRSAQRPATTRDRQPCPCEPLEPRVLLSASAALDAHGAGLAPGPVRLTAIHASFAPAGPVALAAIAPPHTYQPGGPGSSRVTNERAWFSWEPVEGATGYRLFLRDLDTGAIIYNRTFQGENAAAIDLPAGILETRRGYEWWMVSLQGSEESSPSVVRRFQTADTFMPAPVPQEPGVPDGAPSLLPTAGATFEWTPSAQATQYQLYIRDLDTWQLHTFTPPVGTNSLHVPAGTLTPGHRFKWFMTATDPQGEVTDASLARYFELPLPAGVPQRLEGTIIGTAGSYKNRGWIKENALDGRVHTFFDGPRSNNVWVGYDLGEAHTIDRVRYYPRANLAQRMVGGRFQASADGVTWVNVATVTRRPIYGWNELNVGNDDAFQYVRYLGPAGSFGNVAELEFLGRPANPVPPTAPDLQHNFRLSDPGPFKSGSHVTVNGSVRNRGERGSNPTALVATLHQVIGNSTQQIAVLRTREIGSLVAGGGAGMTLDLPLPSSLPSGEYVIVLDVDARDTAGQANDDNDRVSFPITIVAANSTHVRLLGEIIGTAGSFKNWGNTRERAFDGNGTTFFDAPTANFAWVGLKVDEPAIIKTIVYTPRAAFPERMVGGRFQASHDGVNWTTLGTVTTTPNFGRIVMQVNNPDAFRYVRYYSPFGGFCNIAELEFYTPA